MHAVSSSTRAVLFLLLALSLVMLGPLPVAARPAAAPPPAQVVSGATAPTEASPELQAVREAYELLLDRYAVPLDPAVLVEAADKAMTEALEAAGVESVSRGLTAPGSEPAQQWNILRQRHQGLTARYGDLLSPQDLAHAAIAGMALSTDDTHTNFLSPQAYEEHQRWTRGEVSYGGIGARMRGPLPTVVEVFRDTPAERGGLRPGDAIVAVDGRTTEDTRLDEVITWIRGEEGVPVVLSVQRAVTGQVEDLNLTRARVMMPFVESRRIGDIGYVLLRGFPEPSVIAGVEQAIEQYQRDGVQAIILDLRGNSGGRIDVGTRLLSRFVPEGPIYQAVDRRGRQEVVNVRESRPILSVPFAVLIDEGTASMGEIFAAAVQEHRVGRVFGVTTAGSVAASIVLPLSDGSALQLSIEQVYTGGGALLDKIGVTPDEEIELDLEDLRLGYDGQLQSAVDYLHDQAAARQTAAATPAR